MLFCFHQPFLFCLQMPVELGFPGSMTCQSVLSFMLWGIRVIKVTTQYIHKSDLNSRRSIVSYHHARNKRSVRCFNRVNLNNLLFAGNLSMCEGTLQLSKGALDRNSVLPAKSRDDDTGLKQEFRKLSHVQDLLDNITFRLWPSLRSEKAPSHLR
jgi:hypothetical protein